MDLDIAKDSWQNRIVQAIGSDRGPDQRRRQAPWSRSEADARLGQDADSDDEGGVDFVQVEEAYEEESEPTCVLAAVLGATIHTKIASLSLEQAWESFGSVVAGEVVLPRPDRERRPTAVCRIVAFSPVEALLDRVLVAA